MFQPFRGGIQLKKMHGVNRKRSNYPRSIRYLWKILILFQILKIIKSNPNIYFLRLSWGAFNFIAIYFIKKVLFCRKKAYKFLCAGF